LDAEKDFAARVDIAEYRPTNKAVKEKSFIVVT
jgi:hypothetical protein